MTLMTLRETGKGFLPVCSELFLEKGAWPALRETRIGRIVCSNWWDRVHSYKAPRVIAGIVECSLAGSKVVSLE
jgi:hypothetical protein